MTIGALGLFHTLRAPNEVYSVGTDLRILVQLTRVTETSWLTVAVHFLGHSVETMLATDTIGVDPGPETVRHLDLNLSGMMTPGWGNCRITVRSKDGNLLGSRIMPVGQ